MVLNRDAGIVLTRRELEARGGFEPPIKVLPTFALSLGDRAFVKCGSFVLVTFVPCDSKTRTSDAKVG